MEREKTSFIPEVCERVKSALNAAALYALRLRAGRPEMKEEVIELEVPGVYADDTKPQRKTLTVEELKALFAADTRDISSPEYSVMETDIILMGGELISREPMGMRIAQEQQAQKKRRGR